MAGSNCDRTTQVIDEFQRIFEEGMDEFVSGNWQGSKAFFEQVRARRYSSWPAPLLRVLRLPRALSGARIGPPFQVPHVRVTQI